MCMHWQDLLSAHARERGRGGEGGGGGEGERERGREREVAMREPIQTEIQNAICNLGQLTQLE